MTVASQEEFDPKTVRGVTVLVACYYCQEKGVLPGGKYQSQGEVVNCPVCAGRRMVPKALTMAQFRRVLDREELHHG